MGAAFVLPEARKGGVFRLLSDRLHAAAAQSGVRALYSLSVTHHVATQKASEALGRITVELRLATDLPRACHQFLMCGIMSKANRRPSRQQDAGRSQMDAGQEVPGQLVIAGGNRSILLEFLEKILNEMARLVPLSIILTPHDTITFRWNHRRDLRCRQYRQYPVIGVIGLVGQQGVRRQARQQLIGPHQVRGLPSAEHKTRRIAQGVRQGMNLGAQAALAAPDGLVAPRFFWAPALC